MPCCALSLSLPLSITEHRFPAAMARRKHRKRARPHSHPPSGPPLVKVREPLVGSQQPAGRAVRLLLSRVCPLAPQITIGD